MNRLVKEYDNVPAKSNELSEEIKRLEEENLQLSQEIKSLIEKSQTNGTHKSAAAFSPAPFTNGNHSINSNGFEANFFSPTSQEAFPVDDPFQTFDPFKDGSSDPFKADSVLNGKSPIPGIDGEDPFSNGFDPFKANNNDNSRKPPPPRPAPPRPQTPSLKPTKPIADPTLRPQSAMDFTRNNKLDLFNEFTADPFGSATITPANTSSANAPPANNGFNKDPFGGNGVDWSGFGTAVTAGSSREKDPFDPFA